MISCEGDLFLISAALELHQHLRYQQPANVCRILAKTTQVKQKLGEKTGNKGTLAALDACFFTGVQARLEKRHLKELLCQLLSLNLAVP